MPQSYTFLCVHFVFATKGRERVIVPDMKGRLIEYIGGICRAERCALMAAEAMEEHAHLLVRMHADASMSKLMREVKARSSAFVRDAFPEVTWPGWQNGYGGFSVSRSGVESVKEYIAKQEEHHRRMSFEEEFVALLERHGVEFDRRYVWRDG